MKGKEPEIGCKYTFFLLDLIAKVCCPRILALDETSVLVKSSLVWALCYILLIDNLNYGK